MSCINYTAFGRGTEVPSWKLSRNLPRLVWTWTDHPFDVYIDLHKKYGPIVRYGPDAISISDVAELPTIYGFHYIYEKVQRQAAPCIENVADPLTVRLV